MFHVETNGFWGNQIYEKYGAVHWRVWRGHPHEFLNGCCSAQGSNGIQWTRGIHGNDLVLCIYLYKCDLCLYLGEHAHVRSIQKLEADFPSRAPFERLRRCWQMRFYMLQVVSSNCGWLTASSPFYLFSRCVRTLEVHIFGMGWKHQSPIIKVPKQEGPRNDEPPVFEVY